MNTFLLMLLVFVTSPLSLQLPRMPTAIVVFLFVGIAWALQNGERTGTKIDAVALAFLIFSATNGVVSGLSGNMWREILNQLMPIPEVYFCYVLVSRCRWNEPRASKSIRIVLISVCVRAAWQLLLTLSGHFVIPPIYPPEDSLHALVSIGNFEYVRLIDPVCGIFFALSLVLYFYRVHRRLSGITAILCGAVSMLGVTRSQWLATLSVLGLLLWFGKQQKVVRNFLLVAGGAFLGVFTLLALSPDAQEFAQQRFVRHTIEQVTDQGNEYSELRILEIYTAIEKFKDAPLLGHGLGSELGTVIDVGSELTFAVLHNYYLNWMATTGVVGIVLFSWMMYRVSRFSFVLVRMSKTNLSKALSLCAMGSLLWWGVFMAFMAIYSAYHVTVIIGAAYGMAVALAAPQERRACSASSRTAIAPNATGDCLIPESA